ncbi:Hypothetical predicted protein [Pelobates cultripes]|uniref:Uncharacterized protein n=1 Tax=Pelobates cultripes TaxID=61616 RepID=A0AAD1S633_PELCU|nr:Hypothetical predicted protein [Pelobates cultripes]
MTPDPPSRLTPAPRGPSGTSTPYHGCNPREAGDQLRERQGWTVFCCLLWWTLTHCCMKRTEQVSDSSGTPPVFEVSATPQRRLLTEAALVVPNGRSENGIKATSQDLA